MVFLRLKILVVVFATVGLSMSNAQTFEELQKAFIKSYELEKKGEYKQAADAVKGIYSEDSYEINIRLAWLEYNAGLFSESAAHYQKAVDLKPYSEEAKFGLTYPQAALGKWTEVENIYKKILEISPNNTTANYKLGLIYYGRKNYTTAFTYFSKVLDLYPFDYDGLHMTAWTNYFLGKKREAKVLFQKALLYKPGDDSAKQGLELCK